MSGADKLGYLIRALSRTKRKDYENYVVNAIWNRLAMDDVKPVTQQLVLWPDGRRSFVDLYFPQAMIGVECDEAYHQRQRERDREREITITDVLRQIRGEDYRALHVDVSGSYEQVERSIDDCVRRIRAEIERRRQANEFTPWTEAYVDYKEFYKTRDAVSVADDVGFPRIADAVNTLCGSEYKRFQESWFVPSVMRQWYGGRYRVWFPKLAIGGKAVANGWNNRLSDDGTYIYEYNEDADLVDPVGDGDPNDIRITFAKSADPVTRIQAYRFVGVFRRISNSEDGTRKRYQRIETVFPIHRTPCLPIHR